jgi:NhaP-type Na+/H+ or K+/H+ antiporter
MLNDSVLNTAISFAVPFLASLPAEESHASGVLAVVVAGLVTGHQSPRFLPDVRAARISSRGWTRSTLGTMPVKLLRNARVS